MHCEVKEDPPGKKETAANGHGSTSVDFAVFLIGSPSKGGSRGLWLCYYFGLHFNGRVLLP